MLNVYWNLKTDLGKEKEEETEQKSSETEKKKLNTKDQKQKRRNWTKKIRTKYLLSRFSWLAVSVSCGWSCFVIFLSKTNFNIFFQVFNANTTVHFFGADSKFFLILFQTKLIWNSKIFWDIWSWNINLNVICQKYYNTFSVLYKILWKGFFPIFILLTFGCGKI